MKDEKNVENLLLVKKALLLVGYKKNRKEEVLNMCLKNVKVKKSFKIDYLFILIVYFY
ncbi:hypothetical protein ABER90_11440 [Bacillus paranthracis]|uniref:hypothetical protein n=1 Tax=Bacillus paranthracis TaxID=2026186 RepID=UPI0015C3B29D